MAHAPFAIAPAPTVMIHPVYQPSFSDYTNLLWISFSVHEQLNILEYATYGAAALNTSSMPDSELYEYHSCRH